MNLKSFLIVWFLLTFTLNLYGQPLSVFISGTDSIDCDSNQGSLNAFPSGGTPPYSFSWSIGTTNQGVSQLYAGTYTVTVTDAVSSTATSNFTIDNTVNFHGYYEFHAPSVNNCDGGIIFNPFCDAIFITGGNYNQISSSNGLAIYHFPFCYQGSNIVSNLYSPSCGESNNGFVVEPSIQYAGPYTVDAIPAWLFGTCESNTVFRINNQNKLPIDSLPELSSQFGVSGWFVSPLTQCRANLFDMQGNLIKTLPNIYYRDTLLQHYDFLIFDFDTVIVGPVIFEYLEGISGTDTIGIQLRDTMFLNMDGCGSFSGTIYFDENLNCTYDSLTDLKVPNAVINIQPVNVNVITNSTGQFNAFLPYSTYTAIQTNPYGFSQRCPAPLISFTLDSISPLVVIEIADTSQFPPVCDLIVYSNSGLARPGFDYIMNISVKNENVVSSAPTILTLNVDSILNFISASNSGQYLMHQITWNIPALYGFEEYFITAVMNIPPSTLLGTILSSTAVVSPPACDTNQANNSSSIQRMVTGSYDPNQKSVSPVGAGPLHVIPSDYRLHYTIEFENTGNDTAFKVIVIDSLPLSLDMNTFQMEMASHLYFAQIDNQNVLKITFDNIMLPDSTTNPQASKGFITFSLQQIPGLTDGTVIENNAGIYFDYNIPVITNSILNTVKNGPVAVCQNISVILDSTGNTVVDPVLLNNESYDFYGITGYSVSQSSFSCSQTGVNTVMFYVSNVNGQTDSCVATVIVTDNQMPVVICHDTIISMDTTCTVTISAQDLINSSSDNCGPLVHSLSQSTFDCTNIGLNMVTLTSTDPSGNTIPCQVAITIVDVTGLHNSQSVLQNAALTPNPSSGKLQLPEITMGGAVVVSDYTGRTVYSENNIQVSEKDFSMLPEGIYIFNFVTSTGEVRLKWLKID